MHWDACPSNSEATCSLTPACFNSFAKECLREWKLFLLVLTPISGSHLTLKNLLTILIYPSDHSFKCEKSRWIFFILFFHEYELLHDRLSKPVSCAWSASSHIAPPPLYSNSSSSISIDTCDTNFQPICDLMRLETFWKQLLNLMLLKNDAEQQVQSHRRCWHSNKNS